MDIIHHHSRLPRLLYVGDVPPEETVESPSLLYRLLEDYPPERLHIIFRGGYKTEQSKRLKDITYDQFYLDTLRLPGRYGIKNIATLVAAGFVCRGLRNVVRSFQPDAILSIAHGFGCLSAASLASRLGIPLHFVVHDDWLSWVGVTKHFHPLAERRFARVYSQAASRLCISPYMERAYRERYGVDGEILYPQRPKTIPNFYTPAFRQGSLVVAFAGTVWRGYAQGLCRVAESLSRVGGKLLIFSQHSEHELAAMGLTYSVVETRPFVSADRLVEILRREADLLFVPMDFRTSDNCNMQYAFPSKLSVYTAAGLPMLIWGPPQCSAVRWARENKEVAEVVDTENTGRLENAIDRLAIDYDRRYALAMRSLLVGRECFSYSKGQEIFYRCLRQHHNMASSINIMNDGRSKRSLLTEK